MFWKAKSPSSTHDSTAGQEGEERVVEPVVSSRIQAENRDLPVLEGAQTKALGAHGVRAYVIPSSCRVSGGVLTSRPIAIRGDFSSGRIESPHVSVLPGGSLGAATRTQVLDVRGSVTGDVDASILVEVAASGCVSGRIQSPAIRVVPGAASSGASFVIGNK